MSAPLHRMPTPTSLRPFPLGQPMRIQRIPCDAGCNGGQAPKAVLARPASRFHPSEWETVYEGECPQCLGGGEYERRAGKFNGEWFVVERGVSISRNTYAARIFYCRDADEAMRELRDGHTRRMEWSPLLWEEWTPGVDDAAIFAALGLVWRGR